MSAGHDPPRSPARFDHFRPAPSTARLRGASGNSTAISGTMLSLKENVIRTLPSPARLAPSHGVVAGGAGVPGAAEAAVGGKKSSQ